MTRDDVIARLRSVEPALRAHGVAALYLFGSFARGEAGARSDVDVFVEPASDEFFALSHFTGAYDAIRTAIPEREIGYGTRDGLSRYVRAAAERDAIRVF
ncbi:DNA polymerase, beta domain protein region [Rhodovulum sp. PH10]|uniref:DNA processing protein DprA n=1 Tax=Rhodovulum sp. PH10 TaxID=1187851 RepID=UPI00027C2DB9|nr:DNA processing protein DprA [Rhodovulum sp. PH10]EJW11029.1 DNA polymerase, beta domain protein region [Rhodovulum sp. PH10]